MADNKTEQPTQRRLDKARKEGQFPVSREFVSAVQFLVFVWLLTTYGWDWLTMMRESTRYLLKAAFTTDLTREVLVNHAWLLVNTDVVKPLTAATALLVMTVAAQLLSTSLGFSLKKLAPDLKRLNPMARIRQLPGQNLPVLFQSMILLPVVAMAVWALAMENYEAFQRLPMAGIETGASRIAEVLGTLLWRAGGVFLIFGLVDLFRQRRKHSKELRMSKQELVPLGSGQVRLFVDILATGSFIQPMCSVLRTANGGRTERFGDLLHAAVEFVVREEVRIAHLVLAIRVPCDERDVLP